MTPRQHRLGQIVKTAMATFTMIFLPCRLGGIAPLLRDLCRAAVRTTDPVGPPQPANGFVALDIVQQILKVDHRWRAWVTSRWFGTRTGWPPLAGGASHPQQSGIQIEPKLKLELC